MPIPALLAFAFILVANIAACGGGGGDSSQSPANASPQNPSQAPSPAPQSPGAAANPQAYRTPFPYVDLLHTALAFDASRGRIYAYVPTADAQHRNRFAVIDVNTRAVSYSDSVSFVPWTMTVSRDGRFLYVGTTDTNEVIRLSLPSFAIDLRVPLGSDANAPFPRGMQFDAGHIAVSPIDSELFAVSLVDQTYWTCAIGMRVYKNSTLTAERYNLVDTWIGDVLAFEADGGTLTTLCSGTTPDIVTRVTYTSSGLVIGASERGQGTLARTVEVAPNAILTGAGSKFDMPGMVLRGALRPLTFYSQEPGPLLHGCIFADDSGNYAACFSQTDITDGYPTFRAFVTYELIDGAALQAIPLDLSASGPSRILRIGPGRYAVGVGFSDQDAIPLGPFQHLTQNTRIYFLSL